MESHSVALFQKKEIRRGWHQGQWYFSVSDVVEALSDSRDVRQYVKKMRSRDPELNVNWGTICTPLDLVSRDGKTRKENCAHTEAILRIIQSIPSPQAEPFKRWLARVGKERLDEIQNPELAMARMRSLYEQKGRPKDWIEKRMRGMAVRNDLTKEWEGRGVKESLEYAILTNDIMQGTFEMNVGEYKRYKGLKKENLRDHMNDIELILTMLGEATTTKLTRERDSKGMPHLRKDAKDGGDVAGKARRNIENLGGKKVSSRENFLKEEKKKKLPESE